MSEDGRTEESERVEIPFEPATIAPGAVRGFCVQLGARPGKCLVPLAIRFSEESAEGLDVVSVVRDGRSLIDFDFSRRRGQKIVPVVSYVPRSPSSDLVTILIGNHMSEPRVMRGELVALVAPAPAEETAPAPEEEAERPSFFDRCAGWFADGLARALEDAGSRPAEGFLESEVSPEPPSVRDSIRALASVVVGALERLLDREERGDRLGEVAIGLGPDTLDPGEGREIVVRPQLAFRPTRLMLDPRSASSFSVHDVKVGGRSLLPAASVIPGNLCAFPGLPLGGLEEAAPGTLIVVRVTNDGIQPTVIAGALVGLVGP